MSLSIGESWNEVGAGDQAQSPNNDVINEIWSSGVENTLPSHISLLHISREVNDGTFSLSRSSILLSLSKCTGDLAICLRCLVRCVSIR